MVYSLGTWTVDMNQALVNNGDLISTNLIGKNVENSTPANTELAPDSINGAIVENSIPDSKKRKCTSVAWNHFKRITKDGVEVGTCNYCKSSLRAGKGYVTKSLLRHLEICPRKNNQDISKSLEKQRQIVGNRGSDGKVQFGNYTFDQEHSRNELSSAIILHEYPISMVEHVGFKKFVKSLQPLFKMVSRNTIKSDIMKIYDAEFTKLYKELEKLKSRIAITTDMWTSKQKKGYMSITAHYIDENWQLQSRILRYEYFSILSYMYFSNCMKLAEVISNTINFIIYCF